VTADTGGGLSFYDITISSDHSHGGQDLTGAWGFVPDQYLRFMFDEEVKAIEAAYHSMQDATIKEGFADTPGPCDPARILNDQMNSATCAGTDPNDVMDPQMRVMQALSVKDGHPIFTLANFAAHATVMGGGNTLISPDWPGVAAKYLEKDTKSDVGIVIVGAVGRSQPNRQDCTGTELTAAMAHAPGAYDTQSTVVDPGGGDPAAYLQNEQHEGCKLSKYSRTAEGVALQALQSATPLMGTTVDGREMFIHDCATNEGLMALNDAGVAVGAPIARANTPPYFTGDCFGTWVGVFRIGDLVITTNPGEAYPNIRQQFVDATPGGVRYWTTGLSNDQLGYLVSPFPEGYPTVVQQSIPNSNLSFNDNFLFNVSPTIGDHVFCTQLKGAIAMGITTSDKSPTKCTAWQNEPNNVLLPANAGSEPVYPPPTPFAPNGGIVPEAPLTAGLALVGIGAYLTIRRLRSARAS
jgi:hypothetical protein